MPEAISNSDPRSQASFISGVEEARCHLAFPEQISPCLVIDEFFDSGWYGVSFLGLAILASVLVEFFQKRNRRDIALWRSKGWFKLGHNKDQFKNCCSLYAPRTPLPDIVEYIDMTKASRKEVWDYLNS